MKKIESAEKAQQAKAATGKATANKEKPVKPLVGDKLTKELLKLIRKHCSECMGGGSVKIVDGRHVVEPDCEISTCNLYRIRNGELDIT
ncbi:hypothetical protein [Desulfovibrio sp. An276]|uniref:hypothetical protein n=1 Tax=Desulfovibrio sp. An276 TaxID=1965618 RepID=UPI00118545B2|nr:hypothetical protein [Desulfovibrio sp. An276]